MSFALRATLKVILEEKAGTWCALPWLAGRVVRPQHEVQRLCDDMVELGEAQTTTLEFGPRCFGIACHSTREVQQ